MKDGKPEVLIIGEDHPQFYYTFIQSFAKKKKISFKLGRLVVERKVLDFENIPLNEVERLVNELALPSRIIQNEIDKISEFGTKRLLFEHPYTRKAIKIFARLMKNRDIAWFKSELLKLAILRLKSGIKSGQNYILDPISLGSSINYKVIPFIVGSTGVYDVGFFEDLKCIDEYAEAYSEHSARLRALVSAENRSESKFNMQKEDERWARVEAQLNRKREMAMVKNIKKMLVDKTVIICGAEHAKAIESGLKDSAYLRPITYFDY